MTQTTLTKSVIRRDLLTAEGILVWVTNVGIAVTAVVPNGTNWAHAGAYIAFVTGLHTVARSLLRAQSAQKALGLPSATSFDPIDPSVISSAVSDLFKGAGTSPDVPSPQEVPDGATVIEGEQPENTGSVEAAPGAATPLTPPPGAPSPA